MPSLTHHGLLVVAFILTAGALVLPGCDAVSDVRVLPNFDVVDEEEKAALAVLPYPADIPPAENLDIVVRRDRGSIVLINRTPAAYTQAYLWLNQQYVARIDAVDIGSNGGIDLDNFINQHREVFPTATLLAPDAGDRIVLAELFVPATAKRYRLLVRDDS